MLLLLQTDLQQFNRVITKRCATCTLGTKKIHNSKARWLSALISHLCHISLTKDHSASEFLGKMEKDKNTAMQKIIFVLLDQMVWGALRKTHLGGGSIPSPQLWARVIHVM